MFAAPGSIYNRGAEPRRFESGLWFSARPERRLECSPDGSYMTYFAVAFGATEWPDDVKDEEYQAQKGRCGLRILGSHKSRERNGNLVLI
jgi:hypothetical protein